MNGKTVLLVVGTIVVVLLIGWGIAHAALGQCFGGGRHFDGPLGRMCRSHVGRMMTLRAELDLTEEQHEALRQLLHDHKEEIEPVAKEMVKSKRALRDAVLSEDADEREIREAAADLSDALGDAAVLASKLADEARGILTQKQVDLLQECMEEQDKSADKWLGKVFQ